MGLSRRRTQLWLGQKLRTPVFVDFDSSAQAEEFVVLMVPTLVGHQHVKVHSPETDIGVCIVLSMFWCGSPFIAIYIHNSYVYLCVSDITNHAHKGWYVHVGMTWI